jgi:hypothetical protein
MHRQHAPPDPTKLTEAEGYAARTPLHLKPYTRLADYVTLLYNYMLMLCSEADHDRARSLY